MKGGVFHTLVPHLSGNCGLRIVRVDRWRCDQKYVRLSSPCSVGVDCFLGMCTKFSEVTLAVHFREKNADGELVGGPMYYIKNGLKKNWIWLAYLFSAFGVLTVFGTGNATQVNTIITAIDSALYNYNLLSEEAAPVLNLILGIILAVLIALILIGGIKRIGQVTEKLVPFMAIIYIILAVGVVLINFRTIISGRF